MPYNKIERTWTVDAEKGRVVEGRTVTGKLHFLPDRFRVDGEVTTELRKLGIYSARLYHADTHVDGHFRVPANYGIKNNFADYTFQKPYVSVGMVLAFFYFLLLSLAEHRGFALAYIISLVACVLLIGFYVSHVLQSIGRGVGFTEGLSFLYALLYG